MLGACIIAAICGIINRMRGDDRWMGVPIGNLPGRALWYTAPAIGTIAWLVTGNMLSGVAWGAGFLFWAIWAWGYLQLLGHQIEGKQPTALETALIELAAGNAHLALTFRHMFALPAFVAAALVSGEPMVAALVVPFSAAIVAIYAAAWRWHPSNPIWLAELGTGALWGAAIIAV